MATPSSRVAVCAALLIVGLVGCRAGGESAQQAPAAVPATVDYVFCFLVSGGAAVTPERANELQAGHMANIGRLADERVLLIAGPFGEPRLRPDMRGLFLFDVPSVSAARTLVATDPAVEARTLAAELHPFHAARILRELPDVYEADLRERRAVDPDAPEFIGRRFVLAMAADVAAAERALAPLVDDGRVLWSGVFGAGEYKGRALYCLDEIDVDSARQRLEAAAARTETEVEWQVLGWYASSALTRLPALERARKAAKPEKESRVRFGGSIQAGIQHRN